MKTPSVKAWLAALALMLPASGAEILESGPHHDLVQWVRERTDSQGRRILETNRYVETATGLNRWRPLVREWVRAEPEFRTTWRGYLVALRTQHKLILPPDISEEPLDVLAPDGAGLTSAPFGVAYLYHFIDSRGLGKPPGRGPRNARP